MKRHFLNLWPVLASFAIVGVLLGRTKPEAPSLQLARRTIQIPERPYQVPPDGQFHQIRISITCEGSFTDAEYLLPGGARFQKEIAVPEASRVQLFDNDQLKGEARL